MSRTDELIKEHAGDWSVHDIAEAAGVTIGRVYDRAPKLGVSVKRLRYAKPARVNYWSAPDPEEYAEYINSIIEFYDGVFTKSAATAYAVKQLGLVARDELRLREKELAAREEELAREAAAREAAEDDE